MTAAEYIGFLHEVPKDWDTNRWERHEKATGQKPDLPPIDAGKYLLSACFEIGWAESVMGGLRPVQWSEIKAYADLCGEIKEPWEAKLIKTMSERYCRGRKSGENALARPPWDGSRLVSAVRMRRH